MFSNRSLIAAIAWLGVLAQGAAAAGAAEFVLRLGSTNPPGSAADADFEAVARAIEQEFRRSHRSRLEAGRRLWQGPGNVRHGRKGRPGDGRYGAGLQPRPFSAVVGDGIAADVQEFGRRHQGHDGALQGRPARQGFHDGQAARPLRAGALPDLHDRQEDRDGAEFSRHADSRAQHHGRSGAVQARRHSARHAQPNGRRHPRQQHPRCALHRLDLAAQHQGDRRQAAGRSGQRGG